MRPAIVIVAAPCRIPSMAGPNLLRSRRLRAAALLSQDSAIIVRSQRAIAGGLRATAAFLEYIPLSRHV
jgi:hypothetical protein